MAHDPKPKDENTIMFVDANGNPRCLLQDWGEGAWGVMVMDPDGRRVALVGAAPDGSVTLQIPSQTEPPTGPGYGLRHDPDGHVALLTYEDGQIAEWSDVTTDIRRRFKPFIPDSEN